LRLDACCSWLETLAWGLELVAWSLVLGSWLGNRY
jgi:hypothetical protein